MRILVAVQGSYGHRIADNIAAHLPPGWEMARITLPAALPPIVDDPAEFLPPDVGAADLLIAMSESSAGAQLIPALAQRAGVQGVICPVDDPAWLPLGLRNQVERELAEMGIASAFPKTFCTLTETSYGYGAFARSYDSEVIALFARHFGRPLLDIAIDGETGTIAEVKVVRGAPCGSTFHVARRLIGMPAAQAVPQAGLICHHYPCMASMQQEEIDSGDFNTVMHISGYVVNEEVEREIAAAKGTGSHR